nr:putative ribonuclease H-like domain-containing protein [Tanacetum cinerariifolium]
MSTMAVNVLTVAAKNRPPMLEKGGYDSWQSRILLYIEDSPVPIRVVEGVLQLVAPTTAKQKLARKNELKARGTLLMALPDKHQLKFNYHKDAKTLMDAIEKSTTDSVSAAASVFAVCAKMLVSFLPNVDSLSNATCKNLGANGPTSMGFDMSKVECYNCHRKRHFARECRSPKDSRRNRSYEWSYQAEEEPANHALMAFSSSSSSSDNEVFTRAMFDCDDHLSSKSDESWPPSSIYDRFQPNDGPTKPKQDLSHTNIPTAPIIEDWVSNSKDESETKALQSVPSFVQSFEQVKSPRHSVQHVETYILAATPKPASPKSASSGKRRNRKACFVCKSLDHLIKDCDYHAKKMAQPTTRTQGPVSAVVPKLKLTRPRHANLIVTKTNSPIRRHITCSPSPKTSNSPPRVTAVKALVGNPQHALKDKGVIDNGCSRHIIENMSYLFDFVELNGGYFSFGGNPNGGKIFRKGKIRIVLLRVPRENNMYNVNLKNIVPSGDLTYLFAKATIDKSNLWHRRLGHINFKTINKLVKGNLVRGLPSKAIENDNTCVACKKGKQHRASCKTKPVSSVDQPLYRLHMDLFGPTFVKSLNKKSYCLVVTDDYSRFTWVFFLATKDETSPLLKTFITGLENQLSLKVKVIRSDNETEFKNNDLNQFCGIKRIKKEFSVPRTP